MPWLDVIWNHQSPNGNVAHVRDHGLTPEEVDDVLYDPDRRAVSRRTGRPLAFGYVSDGRYICVVYEQIDDLTVYPITAFETEP